MKWKICGMRDSRNIREVARLCPDYMGFIFYPLSPRYVGDRMPEAVRDLSSGIMKVGVFVNAGIREIRERIDGYGLDMVQLHGDESPAVCLELRKYCKVIKATGVCGAEDIDQATIRYREAADYLLFDTKTPLYGGSGTRFDWGLLDGYRGETDFFLSGGIGIEDALGIRNFRSPRLAAFDLNSRFEKVPGLKDVEKLACFIKETKLKENTDEQN